MNILGTLLDQARRQPQRIVLSEGEDPRIVEGALQAHAEGIAS